MNNEKIINEERMKKVEELINLCERTEMNHTAEQIYNAAIEFYNESNVEKFLKLNGIIIGKLLEREHQPSVSGIENTKLFHKLISEIVS